MKKIRPRVGFSRLLNKKIVSHSKGNLISTSVFYFSGDSSSVASHKKETTVRIGGGEMSKTVFVTRGERKVPLSTHEFVRPQRGIK